MAEQMSSHVVSKAPRARYSKLQTKMNLIKLNSTSVNFIQHYNPHISVTSQTLQHNCALTCHHIYHSTALMTPNMQSHQPNSLNQKHTMLTGNHKSTCLSQIHAPTK